jgi:uncharacterized short protein YbdD (DUF466 family)
MSDLLAAVRAALRAIVGAPDYGRYLAHMACAHPEITPLSRAAFVRERHAARYDRPGTRCC